MCSACLDKNCKQEPKSKELVSFWGAATWHPAWLVGCILLVTDYVADFMTRLLEKCDAPLTNANSSVQKDG